MISYCFLLNNTSFKLLSGIVWSVQISFDYSKNDRGYLTRKTLLVFNLLRIFFSAELCHMDFFCSVYVPFKSIFLSSLHVCVYFKYSRALVISWPKEFWCFLNLLVLCLMLLFQKTKYYTLSCFFFSNFPQNLLFWLGLNDSFVFQNPQRIWYVLFSRSDSVLCLYHWVLWSSFNWLHNF